MQNLSRTPDMNLRCDSEDERGENIPVSDAKFPSLLTELCLRPLSSCHSGTMFSTGQNEVWRWWAGLLTLLWRKTTTKTC